LIASHRDSQVVVAGDDAQSIYGFRFADYRDLGRLYASEEWENITFDVSYRLAPHLLNASQALLQGTNYLGATLKVKPGAGKKILTLRCTTDRYQATAMAAMIRHFMGSTVSSDGDRLRLSDFMVLCPGNKFVDRAAIGLQQEGIETKCVTSRRSIAGDLWRLLLILRMVTRHDPLALRQWLPLVGLTGTEIQEIRLDAMASGESLFSRCTRLADRRVHEVLDSVGALGDATSDIDRFQKILCDFPGLVSDQQLFPAALEAVEEAKESDPTLRGVVNAIYESFGLLDHETEVPEDNAVLVGMLHKAKGLEADFVFVGWAEDRYLPGNVDGEDLDEALRLVYVAMTRAVKNVVFTFHDGYVSGMGRLGERSMSRFLRKIRKHLDVRRVDKSKLDRIARGEAN